MDKIGQLLLILGALGVITGLVFEYASTLAARQARHTTSEVERLEAELRAVESHQQQRAASVQLLLDAELDSLDAVNSSAEQRASHRTLSLVAAGVLLASGVVLVVTGSRRTA